MSSGPARPNLVSPKPMPPSPSRAWARTVKSANPSSSRSENSSTPLIDSCAAMEIDNSRSSSHAGVILSADSGGTTTTIRESCRPPPLSLNSCGLSSPDRRKYNTNSSVITAITPPSIQKKSSSTSALDFRGANRRLSLAERRGSSPLIVSRTFLTAVPSASLEDLREDNTDESQRDTLFVEAAAILRSVSGSTSGSTSFPTPTSANDVDWFDVQRTRSATQPSIGSGWAAEELKSFLFGLSDENLHVHAAADDTIKFKGCGESRSRHPDGRIFPRRRRTLDDANLCAADAAELKSCQSSQCYLESNLKRFRSDDSD